MPNTTHLSILRLGMDAWNNWFSAQPEALPDFSGADLRCVDLSGAVLSGACFRQADLRYANLRGADLRGADLSDARMERADIRDAQLASAIGLTQRHLHFSEGNEKTVIPEGLERPLHWAVTAVPQA